VASPNVHQMADLPVDAWLISAFQNGALWRANPNLPVDAPLESRGATLVVPSSPPRRGAPTSPTDEEPRAAVQKTAAPEFGSGSVQPGRKPNDWQYRGYMAEYCRSG
jgi:hypothetical protein